MKNKTTTTDRVFNILVKSENLLVFIQSLLLIAYIAPEPLPWWITFFPIMLYLSIFFIIIVVGLIQNKFFS